MNLPRSRPPELNPRSAFYLLVFLNFIFSLSIGLGVSIADLLIHINELGLTGGYRTHPAPDWAVAFIYICTFLVVPLILLIPIGFFIVVGSLPWLVFTLFTTVGTVVGSDRLIIKLTAIPVFMLTITSGMSLGLGMAGLKIFDLNWMPVFLLSSTILLAICVTLSFLNLDELV